MKIVVEGFDASGKSTLAKALAARLGLFVTEAGPKPPSNLDAICDAVNQLRMDDVVHSRITPISRYAYQHDCSVFHLNDLAEIRLRFIKKDTIFIYCVGQADTHTVKEYDTKEHLEFIDRYQVTIKSRYDTIFNNINHIRYDFKTDCMEELICRIVELS